MITTIQKWGNSQGLRFTKEVLEGASIHIGDRVEVLVESGAIVVKPISVVRGRYKISDLTSKEIEKDEEVKWGTPVGREAW